MIENTLRGHYNSFLTVLTKDQLQSIDNGVFCGDVHDYYGYNWTKSEMLSHISLNDDEKDRDVLRFAIRSCAILRELYGSLRTAKANNELIRLELHINKLIK